MAAVGEETKDLPVIDFSGLDRSNPTTPEWEAARAKVVDALESYGSFEAVYDRVGPELREELFGKAMPELFALPAEVKMRNLSPIGHLNGYIGQMPGVALESLRTEGAATVEGVQGFTTLLWPQGNPSFFDTVYTYSKHMQELVQVIHRMVLQSLGLEKYFDLHFEPETSGIRLSEYGVSQQTETVVGMRAHTDTNFITTICQRSEGIEVQTKDGEWIHVVSSPNSFTIVIGEAFTAWTNGRFQACVHRVNMSGDEKRYSVLFSARPSDGYMLEPMKELADGDHPLRYKPFNYKEYLKFRSSEEGRKCQNPLEAFCGLKSDEVEAEMIMIDSSSLELRD